MRNGRAKLDPAASASVGVCVCVRVCEGGGAFIEPRFEGFYHHYSVYIHPQATAAPSLRAFCWICYESAVTARVKNKTHRENSGRVQRKALSLLTVFVDSCGLAPLSILLAQVCIWNGHRLKGDVGVGIVVVFQHRRNCAESSLAFYYMVFVFFIAL